VIDAFSKLACPARLHSFAYRPGGVLISLTSHPARVPFLTVSIYSALTQASKPDGVALWLSSREFENFSVGAPLLRMQCFGLWIAFVDDSLFRLALKLVPALKVFPDAVIVTFDDDMFYRSTTLGTLLKSYHRNKSMIHCNRARLVPLAPNGSLQTGRLDSWKMFKRGRCFPRASMRLMCQGVRETLYPPHVLDDRVFRGDLFHELCPLHDDLWFSTMAILRVTFIMMAANCVGLVYPRGFVNVRSLYRVNGRGGLYIQQTVRTFQAFGIPNVLTKHREKFREDIGVNGVLI
jgi:hypothetical protein